MTSSIEQLSFFDKVSNKSEAAGTLFEKRMDDNLATVKRQISDATKETGSPPGSKGAAKKGSK